MIAPVSSITASRAAMPSITPRPNRSDSASSAMAARWALMSWLAPWIATHLPSTITGSPMTRSQIRLPAPVVAAASKSIRSPVRTAWPRCSRTL